MNTCETCKHWVALNGDWGTCREMMATAMVSISYPTPEDTDWGADFDARKDFGCILHEPKVGD